MITLFAYQSVLVNYSDRDKFSIQMTVLVKNLTRPSPGKKCKYPRFLLATRSRPGQVITNLMINNVLTVKFERPINTIKYDVLSLLGSKDSLRQISLLIPDPFWCIAENLGCVGQCSCFVRRLL